MKQRNSVMGGQMKTLSFVLVMALLSLLPCKVMAQDPIDVFKWTFKSSDYTAEVTGLKQNNVSEITIPAEVINPADDKPYKVTAIDFRAFFGKKITKVTFAENSNLRIIDNYSFTDNELTSVEIPASVVKIGESAFQNNEKLTSVTFAEGSNLNTIGDQAFFDTRITSVEIPASVVTIGESAFGYNSNLASVNFAVGSKLYKIGPKAFGQTSLESITLPASLKSIGSYVFDDCKSQKEITMESTEVPSIDVKDESTAIFTGLGNEAENLKIYVPKGTKKNYVANDSWAKAKEYIIDPADGNFSSENLMYSIINIDGKTASVTGVSDSFQGGEITIPAEVISPNDGKTYKVIKIENSAFAQNKKIKEVNFKGSNLQTIDDGAFQDASNLTSIKIPASVLTIGKYAFTGCNLSSVTFDKGSKLESIGEDAFGENSLTSISLPASLKTIGNVIFAKCNSLTEISLQSTKVPTIEDGGCAGIFTENDQNLKIKVPKGTRADYIAADVWSKAENYIEEYIAELLIEDKGKDTEKLALFADTEYPEYTIDYHRIFGTAGQYGSICLPFIVDAYQYQEYFEHVYTLDKVVRHKNGKYQLQFKELAADEYMDFSTPYFIKLKDNVREVDLYNEDPQNITASWVKSAESGMPFLADGDSSPIYPIDEETGETIKTTMVQQYVNFNYCSVPSSDQFKYYTFNNDGTFGVSEEVYPYRMSLSISSTDSNAQSAPHSLSISFGNGSTTGISNVKTSEATAQSGNIYTLSGVLVSSNGSTQGLAKGIYVKDGKKIVVK